ILDGMTVYHVDHFFGMFSAFNADAIKDVQIYKGGFPAKYGGRLSSVVELTGKSGSNEKQFTVGANLLSANISYETPILSKGSWLFSARRSYTDILPSSLYNSMYESVTGEEPATSSLTSMKGGGGGSGAIQQEVIPSFYFYDLNSKLTFTPSHRDLFSLSLYAGRDYLDKSREMNMGGGKYTTSDGSEFDTRVDENLTDWGNLAGSLKWAHQWGSRGFSTLLISNSIYSSVYERDLSVSGSNVVGVDDSSGAARGLGTFAQDESNAVNDISLRFDNQWQLNENHKVEFGAFMADIQTDYEATVKDTITILDMSSQSRSSVLYIQDKWNISPLFDITVGIRSSYFNQTNAIYTTPRFAFGLQLTDYLKLKGAWGQYYQFINNITNENVLQGSNDFWLSADENLLPGYSEHSILGLTYDGSKYLFEVEGYYKTLDNLVEFSRRFQDNSDYLNYFNFGSGLSQGVEFLAQKKFGLFTGWISYTLAEVEHTFPKLNDGEAFPASHDRRHEFKTVGSYKLGPWNFSFTNIFSSGNAYTAPESQYFLEMLDGEEFAYIHVGEKNVYRLPDYYRLDLSASRKFEVGKFDLDAGASIYNVLNHNNVSYRDYDLDVTPIIVSDVSMLGFTPTLFIKAYLK
ncbi:TonB-dependent receptor, partial [bacterium]|nr:TonB-dependent receptor [bacterium]